MSIFTNFFAAYLRRGWRGSYRVTITAARLFKSLRQSPIKTENGILFADLRISSAHSILAFPTSSSGEDTVMKKFVQKGDVVFDIGAHMGFYTLLLSNLVGTDGVVNAFEPNPELLPCLERTLQARGNVVLRKVALSDTTDTVELFIPEDASMASLSNWTDGIAGAVHTTKCKLMRMDDLVEFENVARPQFIKCDVEGAELRVFEGGKRVLDKADAPVILFEANSLAAASFGYNIEECFKFLESLTEPNYQFFEVTQEGIRALESRDVKYTNIVAIPGARLEPNKSDPR
jgi:FkbM family methyltransferase